MKFSDHESNLKFIDIYREWFTYRTHTLHIISLSGDITTEHVVCQLVDLILWYTGVTLMETRFSVQIWLWNTRIFALLQKLTMSRMLNLTRRKGWYCYFTTLCLESRYTDFNIYNIFAIYSGNQIRVKHWFTQTCTSTHSSIMSVNLWIT